MKHLDLEKNIDPKDKAKEWKSWLREKYHVPDTFEIVALFQENGDMEPWKLLCECNDAAPVRIPTKSGIFWYHRDGNLSKVLTPEDRFSPSQNSYVPRKDGRNMTQEESNCIAHSYQLLSILQHSSWYKHAPTIQYNMNGDGKTRADMASLEETIFALLYTRQLFDDHDCVMQTVVNIYKSYSACVLQKNDVTKKWKKLCAYLKESPCNTSVAEFIKSNAELLKVFQYGGLIIHGPEKINDPEMFLKIQKIFTKEKLREFAIFEVNSVMRTVLEMAVDITIPVYENFQLWIKDDCVPIPNIAWQNLLFHWLPTVTKENTSVCVPPQFGIPTNLVIREVKL